MQKKLSLAQNATYNAVGTIVYCLCQWAVTMVVFRMSDAANAGLLQLAISITNIFYTIACYNIRIFQISDINDEYSPSDYIGLRFITSGIAMTLCIIYSVVFGYPFETILCVIAYLLLRFNEAFADVLFGIDQKHYRMDYVGISNIIRGVILITVFTAMFKITGNLFAAVLCSAAATLLAVLLIDCRNTKKLSAIKPAFSFAKIKSMLIKCFPMVLSSACFTAVVSIPRQFLENMRGEDILGYYATVATPVVIIQVLATSIFNPLLSTLSDYYAEGEYKKIRNSLFKTLAIIAALTAVALVGARFLGEFALVLLYGEEIREYSYLLYAIIGCSVLYTLCWLFEGVLTVIRRLKTIAVISIAALLASIALSKPFINLFEMNGVSVCVITSYVVFCISAVAVILFAYLRRKKA